MPASSVNYETEISIALLVKLSFGSIFNWQPGLTSVANTQLFNTSNIYTCLNDVLYHIFIQVNDIIGSFWKLPYAKKKYDPQWHPLLNLHNVNDKLKQYIFHKSVECPLVHRWPHQLMICEQWNILVLWTIYNWKVVSVMPLVLYNVVWCNYQWSVPLCFCNLFTDATKSIALVWLSEIKHVTMYILCFLCLEAQVN